MAEVGTKTEGLTTDDFTFLIGLCLFILFLFFAHPNTFNFAHNNLLFWMAISTLVLGMAPDYIGTKALRESMEDAENKRFYQILLGVAEGLKRKQMQYSFLVAITLGFMGAISYTMGLEWYEIFMGIAYGAFIRGLLS